MRIEKHTKYFYFYRCESGEKKQSERTYELISTSGKRNKEEAGLRESTSCYPVLYALISSLALPIRMVEQQNPWALTMALMLSDLSRAISQPFLAFAAITVKKEEKSISQSSPSKCLGFG